MTEQLGPRPPRPRPVGQPHGYFYSHPRPGGEQPFPPWGVGGALTVVGLFAASQPLASLAASFLLSLGLEPGLTHAQAEDALFRLVLPLVIVISHAVGWLAVAWLLVRRHRLALLTGLRLRNPRRFRWVRIFLAGMALQVIAVALSAFVPPPPDLENPILRFVTQGGWAVAMLVVMAVFMAPFLEEALFRGILLPALRRHLPFLPAALLVTILFAALHGVQTGGHVPALAAIAAAGFALAWLREASGSLWPPVLLHMGFNFTALLPVLLLGDRLAETLQRMG